MIRGAVAAVILMLCATSAFAGEQWNTTDKTLGTILGTGILIDWGQTRYISQHPHAFEERNMVLGNHPSLGRVNAHFLGYAAATYAFANYLDGPDRRTFLILMTVYQIATISHNRSIGVKISF
jgi:hypothetical protein